jgi:hypothetical protein
MSNSYFAAELAELGKASEMILGARKGILYDDGPGQDKRTIVLDDLDSDQ